MADLIQLFIDNILPIFLIAGVGYLVAHRWKTSPRLLSQLTFNVFSPCLVFNLLTRNSLPGWDVLKMILFVSTLMAVSGLLAYLVGRLLQLDRSMLAGLMLASMFMNAGNFGLPLTKFAFGEMALAYASLFFVGMSLLTYSVGTIVASLGSASLKDSLLNLLKIPTIYVLPVALLFSQQHWTLPVALARPVELLANAAIPGMLIILGMQLQSARWSGGLRALSAALTIRMVVAPLLAFVLSPLWGWEGDAFKAVMLESAMPTAVMTTLMATEFDAAPSFVAFTVFAGTLLSPLTLTPLMAWLGGG